DGIRDKLVTGVQTCALPIFICLHFNAEGWGDPNEPTFTDINHLHLLVNGSYLQNELELDDERFEMIRRLLSRAYDEEIGAADSRSEERRVGKGWRRQRTARQ